MSAYPGDACDYHRQMGMSEAFRRAFASYANFGGRANRGEYWGFFLGNLLVSAGLHVIDRDFFGTERSVLNPLWSLAVLLPPLALGARRLHDTDWSGWWLLIGLILLVGITVLLVWFAQKGDDRANRFE